MSDDSGSRTRSRYTTGTDNSSLSTTQGGRLSDFTDRVYVNYPVVGRSKVNLVKASKNFETKYIKLPTIRFIFVRLNLLTTTSLTAGQPNIMEQRAGVKEIFSRVYGFLYH